MELEAEGGGAASIFIGPGSRKKEIGRGRGFATADRTVSRRHVSFEPTAPVEGDGEGKGGRDAEARVSFEVLGRNPIVVVTRGGSKRIFRRSEAGELSTRDRVSLSLRHPIFFSLKHRGGGEGGVTEATPEQERTEEDEGIGDAGLEGSLRFPSSDLSQIDPVRAFGFIARGHEFDDYLKRIREPEKWNWFLADQSEGSDREEEEAAAAEKRKKGGRKAKRGGEDDGEWRGDSEDEKMAAAKAGGAGQPGYLTRSEKRRKSAGDRTVGMEADGARKRKLEEEEEEDETLGGFIVGDSGEEEGEQEEEEEEEFDDEDDDD